MNNKKLVPKKLWLYWHQGISDAPYVVKKCIESWIKKNPTWEIIILDSKNINDYIKLDIPEQTLNKILLAHQSDLIRLLLLSKYGGVWADVTTFCIKSLDKWIDDYAQSGFFVFHKPGKDRIMSNWFIASKKDSIICNKLYEKLRLFWIENNFNGENRIQRYAKYKFIQYFNKNNKTTKYWFNPIVTKVFKVYHYFVFHYMFERLVSTDNECKSIWEKTKKVSAITPQLPYLEGLVSPLSNSIKKLIDEKEIPIVKLTYKYEQSKYKKGTVLYYIIEENKQ